MTILALEFSSDQRSVAIYANGAVHADTMETATRATHAFALIERALAEAKMEREQIECIAIGIGPGSYHGIRAAIALGQGWQLAKSVKLLGVSSAECLARSAQAQGWFGKVNVVIDAQRNELYFAGYEITATDCREVSPLKIASIDEVRQHSSHGEIIIGPDVTRWFEDGQPLFADASTLAQIAATRNDFAAGEKLEPIYLRETNFVKAPPPRILPTDYSPKFGAEIVKLSELSLSGNITSLITPDIAKKYQTIPIAKQGNTVVLAVTDPSDLNTIDSLHHHLRCDLELKVASVEEIRAALKKYYSSGAAS